MQNKLGQDFTLPRLLRFTAPSALMLMFMALYQMVDGIFVSNFVGENALSALNIAYPVPSVLIAVSVMLSTGGSALVARTMGEKKPQQAKQDFSLIVVTGVIIGILFAVAGLCFLPSLVRALGATDLLYEDCYNYLFPLIVSAPAAMLQMQFQGFLVTAGKPHLGLALTVIGGVINLLLDYLFIVELKMGVTGAALGTAAGYIVPAIIGLCYFAFVRKGSLCLVRPKFRPAALGEACFNGSSEMVTNLAVAITTLMFNKIMLAYQGENGVAAITIVLYAQFLLTAIFIGFSSGVAPLFSYNHGNKNYVQIQKLFRSSLWLIGTFSVLMFAVAFVFAVPIISVFTRPDSAVFALTVRGFHLFAFSYLITGFNIFASSLFTAFSNGKASAFLSFLRTFLFLIASLLLLPRLLGADGIWLSVPLAELLSLVVAVWLVIANRDYYQYY